jgi:hypothetical protein
MTALESFNALDNREVSRKEVEQVLTQAKAENNTAIIYRLSRVLNDSPEATHFEITITHYDSSVGLSGVQHTGDYREALDDCGRLRKGWKFVKGNVVKVEEKPKKEAKPKKEKAPQKEVKNIENTVTFLHTERFKDDLSYHALERSYSWISFDPEKRAKREKQDWADSMEQLYNSHAEQAQQTGALEAYNAAFEKGYAWLLKNYNEMISIRARTFSTAVTGGAGITARKIASNESLMQREYEKLKIHNQEVKKLKNKLAKIAKNTPADQYETGEVVKSVDVNAIAKLQDKIKQLEEKKEYIYRQQKAEKEYKKSKDSFVFEKYDIKKEDVEKMLDEINRYGYALYSSPANINAEIRRIRERIAGLEKNQSKGEEEILIEGGKIVKNGATQRLQIFFDGIPDKDIREKLKRHAFKWAPSVKAWQRTLTPNAIWDVEHYLLATGILKKQGLSGVQHTGDYREALDNCGRLHKGWKFVKGNVVKVEEKPKKEAKPKKEKAPQKEEITKEVSGPKVKDFEAFDDLQAQLLAKNADIPESEVLDFLYNFTDAFEEGKTVFRFWNTPGKKPTEAVLQYKKHPLLTRLQNPSAKMRAYELTPRGYELLEKFHKGVERIKKTYDLGYIAGIHKLYNFLRDRKAYTKKENVEDSSKKKLEKAPAKATKSLKSRKEKGENVANFTLLQEPTKVFLEFEDEKNQAYYKKSANKQGAVGADFLKKVIKDLKKQNLREEPRGFINTEDFPVSPTISKVTGIDSLKTVVVKDKNRPTLECVLIEADRYVATDLYNIILLNRSKNDGLKTGALYDPNYKCTKIGGCSKEDYYRILDYGFPNYKPILTENPVYTSDWVAIEPIIQHLKSGLEVIRKIYDWKRVYVVKITSNVGEGHYNLKYLLNDLQILQSNGAKKIRLYTNKLDEKLNIETDNGNIVVTMAVYIGDRSNYDVISPLRIAPVQLHFTQNRKEEKGLSGVDYSQGLFGAVPEVSTERFKKMKVNELRTFTLRYYNLFLKGDSVTIERHLKEVVFTNKAGRKIAHGEAMYSEKAAVIAQLKTLIKNSTYNNWGDRKPQDHPDILGYLNFKSKITIDGEKRHLRISIIVDKDRKLKLKSYDVGKKKSRDPQGGLPSAEGSQLFKAVQSTQDPVGTLQDGRTEPLSEGKGTKKSLSRKKKDENFGLKATEAPVTSLPVPRQTLAQQLATRPEVRESFLVADEQMSLFLGALEKKTKDSLVITLTGKQGSGKTRFAFQFMNALAQRYRVGHASIEEHPESVLYEEKAYQYLNDTALEHITAQDVRSLAELDTMIRTNEVIVIDSFQKMRELEPKFEVDKDLRKKYDGKLFLVIFQQTADGKMRGGSKSQFDGDIILFTETFPDYRENYVYPDKNRYNKRPATELQYSIYEQRMLATAPEVPALPAHYEPTESEELNFEVL